MCEKHKIKLQLTCGEYLCGACYGEELLVGQYKEVKHDYLKYDVSLDRMGHILIVPK